MVFKIFRIFQNPTSIRVFLYSAAATIGKCPSCEVKNLNICLIGCSETGTDMTLCMMLSLEKYARIDFSPGIYITAPRQSLKGLRGIEKQLAEFNFTICPGPRF